MVITMTDYELENEISDNDRKDAEAWIEYAEPTEPCHQCGYTFCSIRDECSRDVMKD